MTKRVIEHEIKLQKSVIVILAVLAIGVCANAFAPVFEYKGCVSTKFDQEVQFLYFIVVPSPRDNNG